ncbi:MAG: tail fiber protein [Romboutsia timonensis]
MATLNSTIINGFLRVVDKVKAKSLEVEDNAVVENLNADLLDGQQGSYYATSQGLTDLTTQVNTNTGNILTNMQNIQKNTESIGTNKGNITNLTTRVTTAEGNITTNANSIKSLQTKTDTTNTNVTNLTARVKTNEDDIAALKTKTDTTNTNVSNLSSQVSTNATNIKKNQDDIAALKTKTDTTNTNVANNTSRIDSILAGTAEIPSVANADQAENANKLGGQLPAYYATAASLNNYLPLVGGTVTGSSSITKILGKSTSTSLGVYGLKGVTSDGSADAPLYLNQGNSQNVYINNTSNLVYHSGNIPKASTTVQGIVKLNNTRTSTSTSEAVTANALKSAYDTVNGALTTHKNDTNIHLTDADRIILTKANKFKGYYETETALNNAHPTGEAGDYAIVNSTDTMWIWDADKEGGAGWKDGAGKGSVISVNNMTGEVVLTKSNIGLGNVDNTSDANKPVSTAQQNALDKKVNKAGDTMTGHLYLNGVQTTSLDTTAKIIFGNSTNTYGVITTNTSKEMVFSTSTSDNLIAVAFSGKKNSFMPAVQNTTADLGSTGDSASQKWRNLYLSAAASVGTSVTAGTYVQAGSYVKSTTYTEATTYLKTGSGVVNFNDKVNVQYNSTDECIEFIFS